jgi:non-specific serine/threonine protein kinase
MIGNPVALPLRTQVREYEIQELVGSGGFGFVYRAKDHTLQRSVALKEYFPASIATRGDDGLVRARLANQSSVYKRGLDSFLAEARVLAQFDDPAIVKVHFFWEQNGTAYMVMPFYDGITLRGMLRHHRDLITVDWLKAFILRITAVLGRLHDAGTYHRDLSPENILILESGGLVLLDFGSSRQPSAADLAGGNDVVLKPGYAPIEQYVADHPLGQGPWTDLYGLGAVLHFLLEGKAPPASITRLQQDTYEMLLAKREHYPAVPVKILAAIDHCLAVQPDRRPQSVGKLKELLAISCDRVPEDFDLYKGVGLSTEFAATTRLMAYDDENELTIPLDPTAVLAAEALLEPAPIVVADVAPTKPEVEPMATPTAPAAAPASVQSVQKNTAATAMPIEKEGPSRRSIWVGLAAFVLFSSVGLWLYLSISPPWKRAPVIASVQTMQLKPSPALQTHSSLPADPPGAVTPPPPASDDGRAAVGVTPQDKQVDVAKPSAGATEVQAARATPPARPEPAKPPAGPRQEATPAEPKAAQEATVAAAQSLAPGVVRLSVKPWGKLSVNGQARGATPPLNQLKLAPGKYQIEISNPGFQSYSRELEVLPGATTIIKHQFE